MSSSRFATVRVETTQGELRYGPSPCNGRLASTRAMPALQSGHWSVSAPDEHRDRTEQNRHGRRERTRRIGQRWCASGAGRAAAASCCVSGVRASRTRKSAPRHSQTSGSAAARRPRRRACATSAVASRAPSSASASSSCAARPARRRRDPVPPARRARWSAYWRPSSSARRRAAARLRGDALELGQRRRDARPDVRRAPLA